MASEETSAFSRKRRRQMVEEQIAGRGIADPAVLEAIGRVPREDYVPQDYFALAYDDRPVPLAQGQTVSQPYIVARMVEALELTPTSRVLDIGTGSGYAAAVLAEIAGEVVSVERLPELAEAARQRLAVAGYGRVSVVVGDGSLGWPTRAPYDGIVAAAASPDVPMVLPQQLAIGGRLVLPVQSGDGQVLIRIRRTADDRYQREELLPVRFVPLVGEGGWAEATR